MIYRQRLLNVAVALRESPRPDLFTMRYYGDCGTPQCALGHYAAREDLQTEWSLKGRFGRKASANGERRNLRGRRIVAGDLSWTASAVAEHFGITKEECEELFGKHGCGNPDRPLDAARYIEDFVEKKWPVPKDDASYQKFRQSLKVIG